LRRDDIDVESDLIPPNDTINCNIAKLTCLAKAEHRLGGFHDLAGEEPDNIEQGRLSFDLLDCFLLRKSACSDSGETPS